MKISRVVAWFSATVGCGLGVVAWSGESNPGKESKAADRPLCPVTGEPADLGVSIRTDEGPVFFCCSHCIGKYQADTDKHAPLVAEQRKVLAGLPKVQVTCPISGKSVDTKVSVEHQGRPVYFCCGQCPAKFQENPSTYRANLANSYSYQTTCPVSGEEINPKAFVELADGPKVFFCCDRCQEKFLTDPAKYADSLKAQGIRIEPGKVKKAEKR